MNGYRAVCDFSPGFSLRFMKMSCPVMGEEIHWSPFCPDLYFDYQRCLIFWTRVEELGPCGRRGLTDESLNKAQMHVCTLKLLISDVLTRDDPNDQPP